MNTGERSRSFPAVAPEILEGIYQHRLLSTPQIHALYTPEATMRWAQSILAELAAAGLARAVGTRTRPPTKLWFLTTTGLETVESAPRLEPRRIQVTPEGAAGQLQAHTLAINEVGVAFVRAAREREDECAPLAWRHEILHPIGPGAGRGGRGGDVVIADAVLRYTRFEPERVSILTRFLELDRATMPMEDLAAKLRRYARLYRYVPEGVTDPGWRTLYPHAFPAVLVVFTGKDRAALERRMHTMLGLARADAEITAATPGEDDADGLVIYCALLEDLVAQGPFARIFLRHDDPTEYVDALGLADTRSGAQDPQERGIHA